MLQHLVDKYLSDINSSQEKKEGVEKGESLSTLLISMSKQSKFHLPEDMKPSAKNK